MTALSVELMDITRNWVSSFVMLCQAFTAADFSCSLFVGLSAFSFDFSKWNACSIGLKSRARLGHSKILHFFTSNNSWVAYAECFGLSCWRSAAIFFLAVELGSKSVRRSCLSDIRGILQCKNRSVKTSFRCWTLSSLVCSFFYQNLPKCWFGCFLLSLWWICLVFETKWQT